MCGPCAPQRTGSSDRSWPWTRSTHPDTWPEPLHAGPCKVQSMMPSCDPACDMEATAEPRLNHKTVGFSRDGNWIPPKIWKYECKITIFDRETLGNHLKHCSGSSLGDVRLIYQMVWTWVRRRYWHVSHIAGTVLVIVGHYIMHHPCCVDTVMLHCLMYPDL